MAESIAALVVFVIFLVTRWIKNADSPQTKLDKANEKIDKAIKVGDESAINLILDNSLRDKVSRDKR